MVDHRRARELTYKGIDKRVMSGSGEITFVNPLFIVMQHSGGDTG